MGILGKLFLTMVRLLSRFRCSLLQISKSSDPFLSGIEREILVQMEIFLINTNVFFKRQPLLHFQVFSKSAVVKNNQSKIKSFHQRGGLIIFSVFIKKNEGY